MDMDQQHLMEGFPDPSLEKIVHQDFFNGTFVHCG
jgi:hypothetical protein